MRTKIKNYVQCLIIVFPYIAWLASVPHVQAQWLSHATERMNMGQGSQWYGAYWYTGFSCHGNNAVAVATYQELTDFQGSYYLAFLISSDGGQTWNVEGGLPAHAWNQGPVINWIDQIDSLNIVAFGDSNIVRSTDGGMTWQELPSPTQHLIEDISFSDPMHGILVAADTVRGTYITADGGSSWSATPFTRPYGWQCHNYGNGMYRIFEYSSGAIYTTHDDWNTFDSANSIIEDTGLAHQYVFSNCSFGTGDTMFAFGVRRNSIGTPFPCIARSTDGGNHWLSVYDDTTGYHDPRWFPGYIHALSDINRDTIIAGLRNNIPNTILWSTNHGVTWRKDTLIFHDTNYPGPGDNFGIGLNSEDQLVGAYSLMAGLQHDLLLESSLTLSEMALASVGHFGAVDTVLVLMPNPALSLLTVSGERPNCRMEVLDMLGREYHCPQNGNTLDVSMLLPGLYFVSDGHSGAKFIKQ